MSSNDNNTLVRHDRQKMPAPILITGKFCACCTPTLSAASLPDRLIVRRPGRVGRPVRVKIHWTKFDREWYNVRFGEMAAVTPQTILYRFARLSPAASVVEAATSQSRCLVAGNVARASSREQYLEKKLQPDNEVDKAAINLKSKKI